MTAPSSTDFAQYSAPEGPWPARWSGAPRLDPLEVLRYPAPEALQSPSDEAVAEALEAGSLVVDEQLRDALPCPQGASSYRLPTGNGISLGWRRRRSWTTRSTPSSAPPWERSTSIVSTGGSRDLEARLAVLESRFWPRLQQFARTSGRWPTPTPWLASESDDSPRARGAGARGDPVLAASVRRAHTARHDRQAGAALATSRHPGALALPRAAVPARLARRLGPLQADVDRRRVGDPPAVPDDGGVHSRLREVRELPVEGDPVSDLHVLGACSRGRTSRRRSRSRATVSSRTARS